MKEQQSSYRQIMKAISLFGGVQVFNIIISIIRSKFVAVLLGPSGMGIMGLLNSTLSLINGITSFGLGTSAVKDVSAANSTHNNERIARTITITRKLVWITGVLGSLTTILLSSWLSQITFGNKNYSFAFIWISITLLFRQVSSGQLVILQGLQKLRHLAKANLFGSVAGLIITVPLYYYLRLDGIVPGIIVTAGASLILSWLYARNVKFAKIKISGKQAILEGRSMLSMGFVISLSNLFSTTGDYLVRIFVRQTGGVDEVGLYNAGIAIITMYMGLILNAMAVDYYPRLSAVATNNELCKQTINRQIEIALLIIAPLLVIFIVFLDWIILLLYSKEFTAIRDMLAWAALGMFFKVPGWSIGFIFLAKAKSSMYFFLQLFSHSLLLALNIAGYHFWGLTGLGISFLIVYPIYIGVAYYINHKKFEFAFTKTAIQIGIIQFILAVLAFLFVELSSPVLKITLCGIVISLSGYYSLSELDKRMDLVLFLKNYLHKNDKH